MPAEAAHSAALDLLASRPLVVLTGAGLSTDSGIPDYRGPGSTARLPMTYSEFVGSAQARQRYWARISPHLLITQNVDGLHESAGSERMVALHGRIHDVTCLGCRVTLTRADLQSLLRELNPGWIADHSAVAVQPDGDVALEETDDFVVPRCTACGGLLKPDVVFFGENVPKDRVAICYDAVDSLGTDGALLVAGSSLSVMSGLRFVKRAARTGTPVVLVNRGATRGDDLASHKIEIGCSEFLGELADLRDSLNATTATEVRHSPARLPA